MKTIYQKTQQNVENFHELAAYVGLTRLGMASCILLF